MSLIFYFSIISIIIFNVVTIHECHTNNTEFEVYKCHKNKVEKIFYLNDIENVDQISNSNNEIKDKQNQILQMTKKNIAEYNESRQNISTNEITGDELITQENKKAYILKTIQKGIQNSIKMINTNDEKKNTIFFKYENNYNKIPYETDEFLFEAFSLTNFSNLRKLYNIEKYFEQSFNSNEPFKTQNFENDDFQLFYTADNRFIIKIITYEEQETLKSMLFDYFSHFCEHPKSLLPKISGLYYIKNNFIATHIIVMPNIYTLPFQSSDERFCLKGTDNVKEDKGNQTFRFFNNNFIEKYPGGFVINSKTHIFITKTLEEDCELLNKLGIINYNLTLITTLTKRLVFYRYDLVKKLESELSYPIDNVIHVNYHEKNLSIVIEFSNVLHKYDPEKNIELTKSNPQNYANRFIDFMTKSVFISSEN